MGDPKPAAELVLGIDVGSTTCKIAAVDPASREIVWSRYRRHETRQPETCRDMLAEVHADFPEVAADRILAFVTGSGAGPLASHVGARFVQEVNAVTLAVERLHPDVDSVVELGGQDAKIILFKGGEDGERRTQCSMNDKCASGTGATIDKCVLKAGMPRDELARLRFDPTRLHHVAAKCGVFAETDIVNLVKSGIPADEVLCSLADAIVQQNLSVLARGNTLKARVLLLGGPNTYLPFLQECWRLRIPESWRERGYRPPAPLADRPSEELIFVPDNAELYAAYGAVLFGLAESSAERAPAAYRGLGPLEEFITEGRKAKLGDNAGPPLVADAVERDAFVERYRLPPWSDAAFRPDTTIRGVLGIDGGSTSSKCVITAEDGTLLKTCYQLSKGNPIQDVRDMLSDVHAWAAGMGCTLEIVACGVTGYAGDVLEEAIGADANLVETVAHAASALHSHPDADVVCDIGGQDIKVLFLQHGHIKSFKLSNSCSAGNGMLLQAMADQFGLPVQEYADNAFAAELSPIFSYGCAVFLDSDRVNFQKEGFSRDELLAGLALVLPKNVWQYVVQVPRMSELGRVFVLQGGTQRNLAALKAQVDYIESRVPGADVRLHPYPGEAGAIGAAMEAIRVVRRRGSSRFVGLDHARTLAYTTRNDEETRCTFCKNNCSRTFIDTATPDGGTARYISGFSCEKGTVEDLDALKALTRRRNEQKKRFPNLVHAEAKLAFKSFFTPEPLPADGTEVDDVEVLQRLLGGVRHKSVRRPFRRSSVDSAARRETLRVGMPRVLNFWSTAPFWRVYFETLGIPAQSVVFSAETSEELWQAGSKYGSVDPCYPAKVTQAHVHDLLFRAHEKKPLDWIFFPCMTHVPTFVENVMDTASCPVVSGTPKVVKAAFTKEVDFFAERCIEYVDPAITLCEPLLCKRQMFRTWGERLGVTEDESDFAVEQAFAALAEFDRRMQERGRAVLDEVERENRVAILMLGRPYHNDPGINHGVLDEYQALGYPILSIRSLPKDRVRHGDWLERFFADDLAKGHVDTPLEIGDVWPENYSVNSVQKVWAAKLAARHPNLAVLDLSSFKCGHDAPTYGLIDSVIAAAGAPYSALHDLDANKPSGSIGIRIKTYAHTLSRVREELEDRAAERARREGGDDGPRSPAGGGGPGEEPVDHWRDLVPGEFTAAQRPHTTILVGGLTAAHDLFVQAGLRGVGYRVQALDTPDNRALQLGREFGNRGQCNPTYFTVGNLVKHLTALRDGGMSTEEIVDRHVFITAGACGPCRFGTYVTEYRKALRDSGFDGFRVLLFQQSGGLKQATGEDLGLEMNPKFFWAVLRAVLLGDVLNAQGYRLRPYEVEEGATDRALGRARAALAAALEKGAGAWWSLARTLRTARRELAAVEVDRTRVKPKVAIIGEFWAMTTEGDGNYALQRFLESEGAEVDIQLVTSWLLYMIWQWRWDTRERLALRGTDRHEREDGSRFALRGVNVRQRLASLFLADKALRGLFQLFARVLGLRGYRLPDMDELAAISHAFYDNHLRGGEGHMEVGKLIQNAVHDKVDMTVSVKPFGCMPSSSVSDGVQSLITELHPDAVFLPLETTGDGAVNAYSRVQMQLFKARRAAERKAEAILAEAGVSVEEVRSYLARRKRLAAAFHRSPHAAASTAANLFAEVAGRLAGRRSRARERSRDRDENGARSPVAAARRAASRLVARRPAATGDASSGPAVARRPPHTRTGHPSLPVVG